MKLDITKFPPAWCKDAVATPRGWAHPKTGELLIALKGMKAELWKNPYQDAELVMVDDPSTQEVALIDEVVTQEVIQETIQETTPIDETVTETTPIDEVVTTESTINETPEPKKRGRPRKDAAK